MSKITEIMLKISSVAYYGFGAKFRQVLRLVVVIYFEVQRECNAHM